jgi:hypothetical protein
MEAVEDRLITGDGRSGSAPYIGHVTRDECRLLGVALVLSIAEARGLWKLRDLFIKTGGFLATSVVILTIAFIPDVHSARAHCVSVRHDRVGSISPHQFGKLSATPR